MPKKISRLIVSSKFSGLLIGITSHLPDYTLCFHLNKSLQIDLRKKEDFLYYSRKQKKDLSYIQYYCEDESRKLTFSLLSNVNQAERLLKKYKQFDYFIFVDGISISTFSQSILNRIRKITEVFSCTLLDVEKEKEIANIQESIELSIIEQKKTIKKRL